jgi:hypothetical protein
LTATVLDQTVDFYYRIFDAIFSNPFRSRIVERLRRDAVVRQVEEAAAAASQSLTRFFLNEHLLETDVAAILTSLMALGEQLQLDNIANPNVSPEHVVQDFLNKLPCPDSLATAGSGAVYRVALHSVVQVLMLVGPVMAEWQKLNFSSTFELPKRVVGKLNDISQQLETLGFSTQSVADERFELTYRDYLLQRFHRVEAGTVRMTTNLSVDLRELFVMPRVSARSGTDPATLKKSDVVAPMDLAAARRLYGDLGLQRGNTVQNEQQGLSLIEQVRKYPRNVVIGPPGSGKSTFLEWLQLKLAAVEEELVLNGKQAIPLLIRVRELDPANLPTGTALIAKATASTDRAAVMPGNWVERHLTDGRILFMLDGLDEIEPKLRDKHVLPWFETLCREYPCSQYLVSSRPVGYPQGTFLKLEFSECDLLDFDESQISEYTRHWCTAIRLARNEPEEEARREGATDGEVIVKSFSEHPFIRSLAKNPLMLSVVCLVNYFEAGTLPQDRVLLYKLCVEGLLHHWDSRRGIKSDFRLDEKLRVCREVALSMQASDRAEFESGKVQEVFAAVLHDSNRADQMIEHVRFRTGLLLERRPGMFAFAHLSFQEYLAALAIHEGNISDRNFKTLIQEHANPRWSEVTALFCRLAPISQARIVIEGLLGQSDTILLSSVLAESYFSAGGELTMDRKLRSRVIKRLALAPSMGPSQLGRFPVKEVAAVANRWVGSSNSNLGVSGAHNWLRDNYKQADLGKMASRLRRWHEMSPLQMAELIHLVHAYATADLVRKVGKKELYRAPGPRFAENSYGSQAVIAFFGFTLRAERGRVPTETSVQPFSSLPEDVITNLLQELANPDVPIDGIDPSGLDALVDRVKPITASRPSFARKLSTLLLAILERVRKEPVHNRIAGLPFKELEKRIKSLSRQRISARGDAS